MKLRALITQYVTFRKSLGAKFKTAETALNTFCDFMGSEVHLTEITPKRVLEFISGSGPITRSWEARYGALSGLYRYAISRCILFDSPLPKTKPKLPDCFLPYIYSAEELRRLFESIAAVCPSVPYRELEAHTVRAILLLLYGAGLRIGETLTLSMNDIDLQNQLITIRDGKFHKTRLVPISKELHQAMYEYTSERALTGRSQDRDSLFFVLKSGRPIKHYHIEAKFRQLCDFADVKRLGAAREQPRLHDLRHSFAVHRLIACYRQGADVQKLLPQLATYLGHVKIQDTQVYLTLTPDLLHEALGRFERYALKEKSNG